MSYILEALKKGEQQRELGHVPTIGSVHASIDTMKRPRWPIILTLVLFLNAGLLLLLFWPPADVGDTVRPRSGPAAALPAPVATGTAAIPPAESGRPRPVGETSGPAVGAAGLAVRPGADVTTAKPRPQEFSMPAPVNRPVRPPVTSPVIPRRVGGLPAELMRGDRPGGTVVPAAARPPRHAVDTGSLPDAEGLPVWPQVPPSIADRIDGDLGLDVHVYSDRIADRFVLIDLRKRRIGDTVRSGLVLENITADGAVLSLSGQRFLLLAR